MFAIDGWFVYWPLAPRDDDRTMRFFAHVLTRGLPFPEAPPEIFRLLPGTAGPACGFAAVSARAAGAGFGAEYGCGREGGERLAGAGVHGADARWRASADGGDHAEGSKRAAADPADTHALWRADAGGIRQGGGEARRRVDAGSLEGTGGRRIHLRRAESARDDSNRKACFS